MTSIDLQKELDEYMFFNGPFPDLSKGMREIPYPITYIPIKDLSQPQRVIVRNGDSATVHDFWNGQGYVDGDGHPISKTEAQAEVDYLNGH